MKISLSPFCNLFVANFVVVLFSDCIMTLTSFPDSIKETKAD